MVKRILLFFVVIALSAGSCSEKNIPVSLKKVEYIGNQLRIDGYYYSVLDDYINLAILYRDGFCIHTCTKKLNDIGPDTLNYIENKLLNNNYIFKIKNVPAHIGIFKIKNTDIEIEVWDDPGSKMGRGIITTFSYYGKIPNDTTFNVYKIVNNRSSKTFTEDLTYHFVKSDSKPDSTNTFIK